MRKPTRSNLSQPTTPEPEPAYSRRKRQRFISLQTKLNITFITILLAIGGVIIYTAIRAIQGGVEEAQRNTLVAAAHATTTDIDAFNTTQLLNIGAQAQWSELLNYFEQLPHQRANSPQAARLLQTLENLQSQNESYLISYGVLDLNGQNLLDTLPLNLGQDESDQLYFVKAMETGKPYASPITFDPQSGLAMFHISSPVRSLNGDIIGLLRMRFKADILQQIIKQHNGLGGKASHAVLLDENGMRLAHGTQEELIYKSIIPYTANQQTELQASQRLPSLPEGQLSTNLTELKFALDSADEESLVISPYTASSQHLGANIVSTMQTQPWRVIFTQPYDIFSEVIWEQSFAIGLIGLFILAVGVVIIFYTTRRLTQPLIELTEVSRQIAGGAMGLKAQVATNDEVSQLAEAINSLAAQFSGLTENSEQRLVEHTQALKEIVTALEISSEISQEITTLLNLEEVLEQVIKQITNQFGFYYTQIYLVDETNADLVMLHGSGEVGRHLKEQGHRLPRNTGIVGMVVSTNKYFHSNNVSQVSNFVPNPLLPETRSELTLPLRKGQEVLGVLDIQARRLDRFKPVDIALMQTLADNIAIAVDNARLITQTQAALYEVERLNRRLTRESWQEFTQGLPLQGYQFNRGNSRPLTNNDVWLPPMKQAVTSKQLVTQTQPGNGDPTRTELAVPLTLRGEIIGVLGLRREETPDWTVEEVAVVETVADQVSRALENARLSKEQEKTIIQLKDIDRLKSEFLTSMSHELRTPLNSIIGFADVLLQGIDGELNDLAMGDIQLIHNSGKHLLALINDILDLSKIEAGKMDLVREALNVHEIIESVLASSTSLVKDKPVEMRVDAPEGLPPVYADKLRLNQILLNLVSNAAKFTHKGSITINARLDEADPGYMRLAVIDTGIGIPENKLGAIFERFRQADMTTTRKYGGTGLGLAICKQLIEMHEGNIQVTSQEKVGSEFFFTIPLA